MFMGVCVISPMGNWRYGLKSHTLYCCNLLIAMLYLMKRNIGNHPVDFPSLQAANRKLAQYVNN